MRYHNITFDDMLNGSGLRVVLWVAGCPHECPGCQNPITWDINGGIPFDDDAHQELMEKLGKNHIAGLTLSGGDPLHPLNREDILALLKEVKALYPQKNVWCYTGYLWEDVYDLPVMKYIDVLLDGRYMEQLRNTALYWVGSSNQRIIDVRKSLDADEVILYKEE